MSENGKVTEEQANEALQQLLQDVHGEGAPSEPTQTQEAAPEPSPAVEVAAPEPGAAEPTPEPEPDDITSLKKRLEEYEAQVAEKEKLHEARWKAFQDRASQNEQILRDRYLRKASTADRALRVLKATRTEQGIPEAEVDGVIRDIEGTMNPASASYVPPAPSPAATEEQAIILNGFLNEKGMTMEEANEFGTWVRSEGATKLTPREQAVAEQSLDGFLRIAHGRWQEGQRESTKQTTRSNAVEAVKSVQRTQREAAKAASIHPRLPRSNWQAPPPRKSPTRTLPRTSFPS